MSALGTSRRQPSASERLGWPGPDALTFEPDPVKVTRPHRREGAVARTHLVDRLRSSPHRPLVLVTAPTGYGKTTTVAQWAETDTRPAAWVTLDELDNDPVFFLRHVVLALDEVEPLPDDVFEPLRRAAPPVSTVALPRLGRALVNRTRPFIVALDDAHLVHSAATLECVEAIVTHLPPGSQLTLIARQTPELPIGRMRVQDQILEIGPEELSMTLEEATVLTAHAGLDLDAVDLRELVDRTEGWPAGLALAMLALRDPTGGTRPLGDFGGDHRLVAEYLHAELLTSLPDDVVQFLLHCSVLGRLSGRRCDLLLDRNGSGQTLEELARSKNLFVVPLDDNQTWYRFHHLFGDLLRAELHAGDPALERDLNARASRCCEDDGDLDAAIRHALAAGDVDRAGDLVLAQTVDYAGRGRNATIGLWLDLFDQEQLESSSSLALATAWFRLGAGDPEAVEHWVAVAAAGEPAAPMADGSPSLEVAVAVLRALIGTHGVGRMIEDADLVRASCTEESIWWASGTMFAGVGHALMGDLVQGRALLRQAERASARMPPQRANSLAVLALIEIEHGDWHEAGVLIDEAVDLVTVNRLDEYLPIVHVFAIAALVAAHRGRADDAARFRRQASRLVRTVGHLAPRTALLVPVLLARTDLELGDRVAARVMVDEADAIRHREPDATLLLDQLDRLRAELAGVDVAVETAGSASLTSAELRVLEYLPTHLSLKEIGEHLFVSRNTVKSQAIATYRKLGVSSRSDAVAAARSLGLIES